jgi:hypothetical protein
MTKQTKPDYAPNKTLERELTQGPGLVEIVVLKGPNTGPPCGSGPWALAVNERSTRIIGSCHFCLMVACESVVSVVE